MEEFEVESLFQPMTYSPKENKIKSKVTPVHKFNKPENDPLIMNVLNLIDEAESDSPIYTP